MVVTAENKKFTHPTNEEDDTKTRIIETFNFKDCASKAGSGKTTFGLSYYIRLRSFLDSVQKVHSQKLSMVKDKPICRLPELPGKASGVTRVKVTRVLSSP